MISALYNCGEFNSNGSSNVWDTLQSKKRMCLLIVYEYYAWTAAQICGKGKIHKEYKTYESYGQRKMRKIIHTHGSN